MIIRFRTNSHKETELQKCYNGYKGCHNLNPFLQVENQPWEHGACVVIHAGNVSLDMKI